MKLLLAVDPESAHAVGAAARRLFPDAEHVIFNTIALMPTVLPETMATGATVAIPTESAMLAAEVDSEAAIEGALDELAGADTSTASTIGDPGREICDEADAIAADVIVLGRSSRGWLSRLVAPSVTEHVIRHAHCPVLVVGHDGTADGEPEPVPR